MLLRYTINRTTFRNLNQVHVACATTVAFWSIGVLALSIAAPPAVRLCITARPAPCTATLPWASAQPPSPPSAPLSLGGMAAAVNFDDGECLVAVDGDVAYCASPVASDYGQILGVIHSFFHYTLVYAQLPTLLAIGLSGSMCQVSVLPAKLTFQPTP